MPGPGAAGRGGHGGAGVTEGLDPMRAHGAALAGLGVMGPSQVASLIGRLGPVEAWAAVASGRGIRARGPRSSAEAARWQVWRDAARCFDVEGFARMVRDLGMGVEVLGVEGFPSCLAADHQPPGVVFTFGDRRVLDGPRVGIVGTRRASRYGLDVAQALGRDLAADGVRVVSGLARGIDAAAHRGALGAAGAPPVGVVGSGLDVVYPRSSAQIWEAVASRGLLLSEAPPGAVPEPWRFPVRNRIIAALSHVVVVVESGPRGGSGHTVEAALARDRPVLAVPGPVTSPGSALPNRLLVEGAAPVRDAQDVLVALALCGAPAPVPTGALAPREGSARGGGVGSSAPPESPAPDSSEARVLDALGWGESSFEVVVSRVGRPPGEVAVALARLEAMGHVSAGAGTWERRGPG